MSYLDDLFSLKGKVAIVTGAARGNGKAIAAALVSAGADVVATDILQEVIDTSEELQCDHFICDITSEESLTGLVNYTIQKHGSIDILFNNAGVTFGQSFEEYSDDKWETTYQVNLKAPFKLSQLVSKHMIEQRSGSIINITSLNADLAFPDNPAYLASKGGLKQLTKSISYDLGKHGIRANNIVPGYMRTQMTAGSWADQDKRKDRENRSILQRWGQPADLSGAAIFLASDASSFITGQDIFVDGGWSVKGI